MLIVVKAECCQFISYKLIHVKALLLHLNERSVRHIAQVLRNREVRLQYKTYVKRAVESNAVISRR